MPENRSTTSRYEPRDLRLGVVRGISYGLFGPPGAFVPQARALGAGLVRAYVYWGQVEPEPGHYTFEAVDALLAQLDGDEEVWITLCSSSPWATRTATDFLPPSPARDIAAYAEFVRRVVRRCAGRVRFWQCDNEPSNTGLLWAGTAEEYVAQLTAMHAAAKQADPDCAVVLGGCGYDVLSGGEGSEPWRFFEHVVAAGRDAYDLFDVHLYGDAALIPAHLAAARRLMASGGPVRPIVAGEYAAPIPFEFPEVGAVLYQELAAAFADAPQTQSTAELAERETRETPERRAMNALYERMAELPPRLQMFMEGCPPELSARRDRINGRQLVMANMQALAEGVRRTVYWNLAPEVSAPVDHRQIMHLMFGKLALMAYQGDDLAIHRPAAGAFALLAERLAGATRVTRVAVGDRPSLRAFEADRGGRGPLLVLWDERDPFDGEDEPPVTVTLPWTAPAVTAVDALGGRPAAELRDGLLRLPVTDTPVFLTA
ncbi:hypothetical protein Sme01_55440 [Sphaerisporangium melleum]|uniref:Uncharacterized protein n=1 Tax=Sphaerisporangium melleum TaxID=321316 RepID=A0A917VWB1_9ACTN|nr:hypothetical protein [Sphaerisporangium melleum]GGL20558.1 hypothetical protein GCM10007964_73150 [Sphaerisporangium melleum]GII73068.1 hypothetical protein Sme01_55440 [Sphaerisporangium melleum]